MGEKCFACENNKCSILRIKECIGEGCKFFKTETQLEREKKQCFEKNLKRGIVNENGEYYKAAAAAEKRKAQDRKADACSR